MKTFYSACEVKKSGLTLSALAQGIRPEINFVSLIVEPENLVPMFFQLEAVKTGRVGTKKFKHLAPGEQRPQVHDAGKAILPDNLDDPEDNRLRTLHGNYVSHLIFSGFRNSSTADQAFISPA
jgi:hypothetical protein